MNNPRLRFSYRINDKQRRESEMSDLESKAVDILNKMEALTTQYAPDVTEAAFMAVRVSGIGDLIICVVLVLFGSIGIYMSGRFKKFCEKKKEEAPGYSSWGEVGEVIVIFAIAFGGTSSLIGAICMFDIWLWVAIFNPELAMAHKILGL